ncbi:hypothetical protein [Mesorhizobium xinjiangense]|uniref:hypothetical protein n=1 Tax=Mesorhizobium xinjiangense TaxID=2678685 RepID=UPI0012ED5331|nr:hypothetical protein [Mesorhizobium xinjiangense]
MIVREEGKNQICCDTCPSSYPNTYADEDFAVMIADAKTAGWSIRKVTDNLERDDDTSDLFGTARRIAGKAERQPYSHTCPDCRAGDREGMF